MGAGQRPTGAGTGRRLADQMQKQRINVRDLASRAGCDERTIMRALNGETTPQLRVAESIATVLECDAEDLWPRVVSGATIHASGLWIRMFPSRAEVPIELWRDVLSEASSRIDICMYGGTFLFDNVHGFLRIVREAADRGTQVRITVGDPGSASVHRRGTEEGIGEALAGRCRMTLSRLEPLDGVHGIELRIHAEPLYVTMFFLDDVLYANHHILGSPAGDNPVFEIPRGADAELWQNYTDSFERVWSGARPVTYPLGY